MKAGDAPAVLPAWSDAFAHEIMRRASCQVRLRSLLPPPSALVRVGDYQLHAAQASGVLTRKTRSRGLGFRRADIEAEHFAPAVRVDADGDDRRQRDDAAPFWRALT